MANTSDGKQFETDFKDSIAKTGYFYMRLRDAVKWGSASNSTFTPSNPCDSVLFTMPFLWLLELKSTKGASISFYPDTPWIRPKGTTKNVMIKANQVKELRDFVKSSGVMAGFIFNFRPRVLKSGLTENMTYFVHITDFIEFAVKSGKSSISEADCRELGTFIPSEIKKVRYKYDIETFVNMAIPHAINKKRTSTEDYKKVVEWMGIFI